MAGGNRKPFLTATVLDQNLLDKCHDNLVNQLELIVDIQAPSGAKSYTNPTANEVEISAVRHGYIVGQTITIIEADDSGLVGDWPIISRTEDSFRINKGSAVSPASGSLEYEQTLHLSDRNKYVGHHFYEARLKFPIVKRTVGEFLSSEIEFSSVQFEINNADQMFNRLLPGGEDFDGWIGKRVSVKLGLRDVAATYTEIFRGKVTDEGGFKRTVKSFTLVARNDFDRINQNFPTTVFDEGTYPDIEDDKVNTTIPVIYGDWTTDVEPDAASIPAFCVNGDNVDVNGASSFSENAQFVISFNANTFFDDSEVYLIRGENIFQFDPADIVNVNGDKNYFEIRQSGTTPAGITSVDTGLFEYKRGDKIFVKVKGKNLGAYDDNIIEIGKDILLSYGGVTSGDFDSTWATYRDKASPTESAISTFKARAWVQQPTPALTYVLSMLEQVRLEAFIDRNLKLKISSVHLDDFDPSPTFTIKNWDLEHDSFQPRLDNRNNFNRSKGVYNFLPNRNENFAETAVFRNDAAIVQAGKEISKQVVCPNLYQESVVADQVKEILKLTGAYLENIELALTWRSLLLDIGNFVKINVDIQGTQFSEIPALIREIGYDPAGMKIPIRLWSFQMVPFPGWSPGFAGITGGSTATIVQE